MYKLYTEPEIKHLSCIKHKDPYLLLHEICYTLNINFTIEEFKNLLSGLDVFVKSGNNGMEYKLQLLPVKGEVRKDSTMVDEINNETKEMHETNTCSPKAAGEKEILYVARTFPEKYYFGYEPTQSIITLLSEIEDEFEILNIEQIRALLEGASIVIDGVEITIIQIKEVRLDEKI